MKLKDDKRSCQRAIFAFANTFLSKNVKLLWSVNKINGFGPFKKYENFSTLYNIAYASRSVTLQRRSVSDKVFEIQPMIFCLPLTICNKIPATAMPEASVIKVKGRLKFAKLIHFSEDDLFFAFSKHSCAFSGYSNALSILFSLFSSLIISEK